MLAPVRVSAPAAMPVSLNEAKAHLRVMERDGNGDALPFEDDALIEAYIAAAVDHLDGWTGILGRALVTQSWRQDFSGFGCLRLPLGPVESITKIEHFDSDNVVRPVDPAAYILHTDARGSYVDLAPGQSWPSVYSRPDAVSVTYVAGVEATDVPPAIKAAILLFVGHLYANREAVGETVMAELPLGFHALVAPYRRIIV